MGNVERMTRGIPVLLCILIIAGSVQAGDPIEFKGSLLQGDFIPYKVNGEGKVLLEMTADPPVDILLIESRYLDSFSLGAAGPGDVDYERGFLNVSDWSGSFTLYEPIEYVVIIDNMDTWDLEGQAIPSGEVEVSLTLDIEQRQLLPVNAWVAIIAAPFVFVIFIHFVRWVDRFRGD